MPSSGSMFQRAGRLVGAMACASLLSAVPPAAAQEEATATQNASGEVAINGEPAAATTAAAPSRTVSTLVSALPASQLPISGGAIQLSLDDALVTAVQRNLGLVIDRYTHEQFRLRVDENLGIYDLNLGAQAYATESTSPATSELTGAAVLTREQQNLNISGSQLTPWGGVATLGTNAFRQEDNSIFTNPNPYYNSDLALELSQPFLRDFGRAVTERGIKIARLNSDIDRDTFELRVTAVLQQVENAYWNLAQARKDVEVAEESLRLARELHQMNRVRVDVGTLAPLELVQSEAGIAARQEQIITSQAAVGNSEDELRRLLHLEDGELWNLPIVPTTAPDTEPLLLDLEKAIATAYAERPELHSQRLQLDILGIQAAYAKNQTLPRLDLTANYGYTGVSGKTFDPDTGAIIDNGDFSDAYSNVFDRDSDHWRVQLDFAYPLQNRAARARKAIADINVEAGKTTLDQLQESVRTEVRTAVRGVNTAQQQIESARSSVRLAEQNLDAERKRYENGLSTSFEVLQIQEDLTEARSRLVAAIAGYRRALAEYGRATGTLLQVENVELNDPLSVEDEDISRFGWGVGER